MEHNDYSFDCIVLTGARTPICSILKRKNHETAENAPMSYKRSKSVVFGSDQILYIPERECKREQVLSFFENVCITAREHVMGFLDVFLQMGLNVHAQKKEHTDFEDDAVQDIDQE